MEESSVVNAFDKLVKAGIAIYDDEQRIVEHTDANLKVRYRRQPHLGSCEHSSLI